TATAAGRTASYRGSNSRCPPSYPVCPGRSSEPDRPRASAAQSGGPGGRLGVVAGGRLVPGAPESGGTAGDRPDGGQGDPRRAQRPPAAPPPPPAPAPSPPRRPRVAPGPPHHPPPRLPLGPTPPGGPGFPAPGPPVPRAAPPPPPPAFPPPPPPPPTPANAPA